MSTQVIDTTEGLAAFLPAWSRFVQQFPNATPFQAPQWLILWWSHFGSGKLHMLVFRNEGTVMGVVPLFLHDWKSRRQLTLIGSGLSDYLDPLIDARRSAAIAECLGSHLEQFDDWDVCDWQDLSCGTPLGGLGRLAEDTPCTRIRITGSFEAFLAGRPSGLRRNLRRYREKAESLDPLRFAATDKAEPALLAALIELHRSRWNRSGEPGMIDSNGAAEFLPSAVQELAEADMLRLFTLYFRGEISAIILAFCNHDTIFPYLTAFDPQHEALGLGRQLLARSLQYAHDQGYRYWDFLRGDEPFKFDWGAELIPKRRVLIEHNGLAERSSGSFARPEVDSPDAVMTGHS